MKQIDMSGKTNVESEALEKCITFACEHDLQNMPNGKYEICGNEIFAVISEYQTSPAAERQWEAHREYVDLQVVIRGEEVVEVSPLSKMICRDYNANQDFLMCDGEAEEKVILQGTKGLLLFPEDAHKPGVENDGSQFIKKIVFKIHHSCLEEC